MKKISARSALLIIGAVILVIAVSTYSYFNLNSVIVMRKGKRIFINRQQANAIITYVENFLLDDSRFAPHFTILLSHKSETAKMTETHILVQSSFSDTKVKKVEIFLDRNRICINDHSFDEHAVYSLPVTDGQYLRKLLNIN